MTARVPMAVLLDVLLAVLLASAIVDARAAAYRCEVDGRVTYGDVPCAVGRQTELAPEPAPDAASRKAAAARAQSEQRALDTVERERLRSDRARVARDDREQAALRRQRLACAKLAVRTKRASEDASAADGRDATKAKTHAKRAAEDEAMQCRRARAS